jgi:hypothetical protein
MTTYEVQQNLIEMINADTYNDLTVGGSLSECASDGDGLEVVDVNGNVFQITITQKH